MRRVPCSTGAPSHISETRQPPSKVTAIESSAFCLQMMSRVLSDRRGRTGSGSEIGSGLRSKCRRCFTARSRSRRGVTRVEQVLRARIGRMILDSLARTGKEQAIENEAQPDCESDYAKTSEPNRCLRVLAVKNQRQDQAKYSCAEAAGRYNYPGAHAAQTLFFIRFKKLLDLRQNIFGDSFQIACVFNLANLLGDGAADLFARGNRGGGDRIRTFETYAHRT